MNKIKTLIIALMLVLIVPVMLFSAANGSTKNAGTLTLREYPGKVIYVFKSATTTATDSIGAMYTKAMLIAPFSGSNAYWTADAYNSATGTEDINITTEYSDNGYTWVSGETIKDALSTTAISDTLNIQNGVSSVLYKTYQYMRLKFDFQAGNPIGTYVWGVIALDKADSGTSNWLKASYSSGIMNSTD